MIFKVFVTQIKVLSALGNNLQVIAAKAENLKVLHVMVGLKFTVLGAQQLHGSGVHQLVTAMRIQFTLSLTKLVNTKYKYLRDHNLMRLTALFCLDHETQLTMSVKTLQPTLLVLNLLGFSKLR